MHFKSNNDLLNQYFFMVKVNFVLLIMQEAGPWTDKHINKIQKVNRDAST